MFDHPISSTVDQSLLKEETRFLDEIYDFLKSLSLTLQDLLSDFATYPPALACLDSELASLHKESQILRENVMFLIDVQLSGSQQAMANASYELKELRQKYKSLQKEWDSQQEHMGRIQSQLFKARNQLQQQSQFCASLGAVTGNLLWKSSRIPPVIDMLLAGILWLLLIALCNDEDKMEQLQNELQGKPEYLKKTCLLHLPQIPLTISGKVHKEEENMAKDVILESNRVGDFLSIVNGSLASFLETYGSLLPSQCTDESQFIMSMCGIVTNIAAAPAGRQFLVSNQTGKELLAQFINVLPTIPTPPGNFLKRLLLMALYNTSINQNGLRFMQEQDNLLPAIAQCLQSDGNHELKLMSLRLLQSITYDIPTCLVFKNILANVPAQLMEDMRLSSEPDFKTVVQEILQNLKRAQIKFNVKLEEEQQFLKSTKQATGSKYPKGISQVVTSVSVSGFTAIRNT